MEMNLEMHDDELAIGIPIVVGQRFRIIIGGLFEGLCVRMRGEVWEGSVVRMHTRHR